MTNDKQPAGDTLFTEENLFSLWNALEYTRATIGSGGRIESNEKPDWVLVHRGRAHSSERFMDQAIDMVQKMRRELASTSAVNFVTSHSRVMVDLEQFVGKECVITLRKGNKCQVHIKQVCSANRVDYYADGEYLDLGAEFTYFAHYSKNGSNGCSTGETRFDIVHIEEVPVKTSTKPIKFSELPESTVEKLADALCPDLKFHRIAPNLNLFPTKRTAK